MHPSKAIQLSVLAFSILGTALAQDPIPQNQPPLTPNPIPRDSFGRIQRDGQLTPTNPIPTSITIPAGAWISVRSNQPLSTKNNTSGDTFTATLTQPLIADGLVLARRGQTVSGRVVESQRSGRVKGTSRLGIELTELSLVDGQQVPVRTQLVETRGGSSVGRDVGAVAATTGTGAAIGAAAAGGSGAGLGAIAGAGAAIIGVLATRGRDTEIYPEEVISFRTLAPLSIATDRSGQAFQPVQQQDFSSPQQLQPRVTRYSQGPSLLYGPSPFYAGSLYSPFYWGPGFYGAGFGAYYSPRFYGRGGYYNRGFIHRR